MEPGVTQTPNHEVTEMGQNVIYRCDTISGHFAISWYQQTPEKGVGSLWFHSVR